MPLRKAVVELIAKEAAKPAPIPVAAKPPTSPYPQQYGDAKGRQISRQGLFQAALQSPAIMQYCPDLPAYLIMVREVAEAGLAFVNE